jgi:hypothetical protein
MITVFRQRHPPCCLLYVSEEGVDGEGAGSEASSLLSYTLIRCLCVFITEELCCSLLIDKTRGKDKTYI